MNWGQEYRQNLRENRPDLYRQLEQEGKLARRVREVDEQAIAMYESLLDGLKKRNPEPKAFLDRVNWLAQIMRTAQEIVRSELILVPDEETEKALERGYYV